MSRFICHFITEKIRYIKRYDKIRVLVYCRNYEKFFSLQLFAHFFLKFYPSDWPKPYSLLKLDKKDYRYLSEDTFHWGKHVIFLWQFCEG